MLLKPLKYYLFSLLIFLLAGSQCIAKAPNHSAIHPHLFVEAKASISLVFEACKTVFVHQAIRIKTIGVRNANRFRSIWMKRRNLMRKQIGVTKRSLKLQNKLGKKLLNKLT
ncbi:MAG: hypothetical protein JKY48_09240 [Flavobacteriales bacterium]|nr:hypothetical protein [Flavobacteriales bacterium]